MNGITYYKLQSPYFGDVTKNCSLNGLEVDQNFFTLEGRDVKSITVDKEHIIITFLNGESINTSLESTLETTYEFDKNNGVLKITRNNVTQEISGFVTADVVKKYVGIVSVDGSLKGNGKPFNPIGLASSQKTGMYKPVEKFIDLTNNGVLPSINEIKAGDRFLTLEKHCVLGLLYNYQGVKQIACDLNCEGNGWRIPSKEDWDDMLNAIEPLEEDKNHNSTMSNKLLGNVAGKLLKSNEMWKTLENDICCDECTCNSSTIVNQNCNQPFYGEIGVERCTCNNNTNGIDKYGFTVLPVGYADDTKQYQYFKERTWYWTATNQEYTNAFTKRFTYNTNKVYQDITPTDFHLSLRLVKDYNGTNHIDSEEILGSTYPTVLMPSVKNGKAIWTAVNIDLSDVDYKGIVPNVNDETVIVNKYFINEWNGKKWIRNELKEGETIVVKHTNVSNDCIEYRVINGILINTSSILYNEVLDAVRNDFENIVKQIDEERLRATEEEQKLNERINENVSKLNEHSDLINNNIDNISLVQQELVDNKTLIQETINKLNTEIEERINDVNEEQNRAEDAENRIQENINNLTTNFETQINNIKNIIPQQEGSEFNKENGILTIKSGDGTNDINVQFSFNFGEI